MSDIALKTSAGKAFKHGFAGVLRILPDDDAPFDIDGRGEVCAVVDIDAGRGSDCEWRADRETLQRIFDGYRALEGAYLSGRLRVCGDMSVMARLLLEGVR